MKIYPKMNLFAVLVWVGTLSPFFHMTGQNTFEIFNDAIPEGTYWNGKDPSRKGGFTKNSKQYVYLNPSHSPATLNGLSLPIRENPGPGEYRYITFAWVKWGGEQIGIKFGHTSTGNDQNVPGKKYDYMYYAGKGDSITTGLMINELAAGNWVVYTRDLWKDFGDFTLTNVSFLCPMRRDAGFDAIILARSEDAFKNAPAVLPTQITETITIDDDGNMILDGYFDEDMVMEEEGVDIDWAAQIQSGGVWMYPLYLLAFVALVIGIQRSITSRGGTLAPRKLRKEVREKVNVGDFTGALEACSGSSSTLAKSLFFILQHTRAGREAVSQTAGDIAVRDVRIHLSRIYPLSVIASLSPLLGLLGTIVGMIEAFGLVALYGDEGGAAILSDSISKALITTAAGLIIAVPCVAGYFILKNRIMRLASVIEVEIEHVITKLYMDTDSAAPDQLKTKEE